MCVTSCLKLSCVATCVKKYHSQGQLYMDLYLISPVNTSSYPLTLKFPLYILSIYLCFQFFVGRWKVVSVSNCFPVHKWPKSIDWKYKSLWKDLGYTSYAYLYSFCFTRQNLSYFGDNYIVEYAICFQFFSAEFGGYSLKY